MVREHAVGSSAASARAAVAAATQDRDSLARQLEEINTLKDGLAVKLAQSLRTADEASSMAQKQDVSMSRLGSSMAQQRSVQRDSM